MIDQLLIYYAPKISLQKVVQKSPEAFLVYIRFTNSGMGSCMVSLKPLLSKDRQNLNAEVTNHVRHRAGGVASRRVYD